MKLTGLWFTPFAVFPFLPKPYLEGQGDLVSRLIMGVNGLLCGS